MNSFFFILAILFSFSYANKQLVNISLEEDASLPSSTYFKKGQVIIPAPVKQEKGGEDALLSSQYLLGVADGVGGWANKGIDPSMYSLSLVQNSWLYFKTTPQHYVTQPEQLLIESALTNPHQGSSTYIICSLFNDHLYAANIGDSGFAILRPVLKNVAKSNGRRFIYDIVIISKPQQQGFNFPMQLGPQGNNPKTDTRTFKVPIQYGDIVLVYSDGVSDNLFFEEIQYMVNIYAEEVKATAGIQLKEFTTAMDMQELAKRITNKAFEKSINTENVSPFAFYSLSHGVIFKGGKSDDISLVAAMVLNSQDNTE